MGGVKALLYPTLYVSTCVDRLDASVRGQLNTARGLLVNNNCLILDFVLLYWISEQRHNRYNGKSKVVD